MAIFPFQDDTESSLKHPLTIFHNEPNNTHTITECIVKMHSSNNICLFNKLPGEVYRFRQLKLSSENGNSSF